MCVLWGMGKMKYKQLKKKKKEPIVLVMNTIITLKRVLEGEELT